MQVTNYQQALSFNYVKAEQIPQQCLIAAKLLDSQPIFDGHGSFVKNRKVIPLESWDDTRIFNIFSYNAAKFTGGQSAWEFHYFGAGTNRLWDTNDKSIARGLSLWLGDDSQRCSLETLEQAYIEVYDALRKGWVESNPEGYQDIMHKKDPEKFALFIKESTISSEDTLIRFLTCKFELKGQVDSESKWLKNDGEKRSKNLIYMWIDKEKLPKIIEKFGFEFQ